MAQSISHHPEHDAADAGATVEKTVVPVLEERLVVGIRRVESGRARVHIKVSEHDEAVETLLMRQDLDIRRVAIGTFVAEAPPVRREGDTMIVSVLEERAVVEKRLFLTEELHIRIGERVEATTQTVRLRREQADIETTREP